MSATGFPFLSNVVMPEATIDPCHTSLNAPQEEEPEYVNVSVNRSGGFAEAAPASPTSVSPSRQAWISCSDEQGDLQLRCAPRGGHARPGARQIDLDPCVARTRR
jgi:hypothetical protein